MLKMIIVILGLIILFLLPVLWKKQKQISMIQEKLDDAKAEAKRMKAQLAEEKQLSESQLEEQKKQIENLSAFLLFKKLYSKSKKLYRSI